MTLQIVFLFVVWLVAGFMFARAWRGGTSQASRHGPYEQLGQKQP